MTIGFQADPVLNSGKVGRPRGEETCLGLTGGIRECRLP